MLPARLSLPVLLLAVAACGRDKAASQALPTAEAARLLVDRNWLDRMPDSPDDQLHVYRFTPSMGGGVYQDRTLFAGKFELFRFAVEADQLTFLLPHKHEKHRTHFTITPVDHPPFDLQLILESSPRGPRIFYGMRHEHADDADVSNLLHRSLGADANVQP